MSRTTCQRVVIGPSTEDFWDREYGMSVRKDPCPRHRVLSIKIAAVADDPFYSKVVCMTEGGEKYVSFQRTRRSETA